MSASGAASSSAATSCGRGEDKGGETQERRQRDALFSHENGKPLRLLVLGGLLQALGRILCRSSCTTCGASHFWYRSFLQPPPRPQSSRSSGCLPHIVLAANSLCSVRLCVVCIMKVEYGQCRWKEERGMQMVRTYPLSLVTTQPYILVLSYSRTLVLSFSRTLVLSYSCTILHAVAPSSNLGLPCTLKVMRWLCR